MLRVDIGEVLVTLKDDDYVFIPSFRNLSKLGSGSDIVEACVTLSNRQEQNVLSSFKQIPQCVTPYLNKLHSKKIDIAITILACCCNKDIIALVGNYKPNKKRTRLKRVKGVMTDDEIILLAKTMLDFGVMGRAKVRVSMKNQSKSYASEFNIMNYINNARIHLGLPREEAEKLTMTEYIMLMSAKFPDNDGQTQEEYDERIEQYFKEREKQRSQLIQAT